MRWGLIIGLPVTAALVVSITHPRTPAPAPAVSPQSQEIIPLQEAPMATATTSSTADGPDWSAIAAAAAHAVGMATSYQCGLSGCQAIFTGTAYVLDAPWSASSGHTGTQPVVVTARHVVCDPGDRIDKATAAGATITDAGTPGAHSSGLCLYPGLGGAPAADLASFAYTGTTAALQVASHSPTVSQPVVVLGHPLGESPTAPVVVDGKVLATDVTFTESAENGLPARTISGAIEVQADSFPGNSGSPVIDAHGRVIGTVVAGGAEAQPGGTSVQVAFVVPWQGAPVGYVQQDGMVNGPVECPGGLAGLLCRA